MNNNSKISHYRSHSNSSYSRSSQSKSSHHKPKIHKNNSKPIDLCSDDDADDDKSRKKTKDVKFKYILNKTVSQVSKEQLNLLSSNVDLDEELSMGQVEIITSL